MYFVQKEKKKHLVDAGGNLTKNILIMFFVNNDYFKLLFLND